MAMKGSSRTDSQNSEKFEHKLIGLKTAMGTSFDSSNVHQLEKSIEQIDVLNRELKSFYQSLTESNETKVNNLHEQLQGKVRANKRAEEQIQDLEEQLEQYKSDEQDSDGAVDRLKMELQSITQEKDSLNVLLDEQTTINQEMKDMNGSMEKELELLRNELNEMKLEIMDRETGESPVATRGDDVNNDVQEMNNAAASEEVAQTKSNMAQLLRDLIEVEQQNERFKWICAMLARTTILIAGYSVNKSKQIKEIKQSYEELNERIESMINFRSL